MFNGFKFFKDFKSKAWAEETQIRLAKRVMLRGFREGFVNCLILRILFVG